MGICNKAAGVLAPVLFGILVLSGIGDLDQQLQAADPATRELLLDTLAAKIHVPYMAMAAVLAVLAVWIARSSLPEIEPASANVATGDARGGIFHFPHLWLGVLCLFVYVGVEVMAGDAIGTYGAGFHLPLDRTKFFTAFTLTAMLIGYLAGLLLIPRFVSQQRYLAISAVLGVLLSLGAYLTHGYVSVGFVAALGLPTR